jgi:hypothetical protein
MHENNCLDHPKAKPFFVQDGLILLGRNRSILKLEFRSAKKKR